MPARKKKSPAGAIILILIEAKLIDVCQVNNLNISKSILYLFDYGFPRNGKEPSNCISEKQFCFRILFLFC